MDEIAYAASAASVKLVPSLKRVRAEIAGTVVADSTRTLLLLERGHFPVYYFPPEDVRQDLLTPTQHQTHCPRKGDAYYRTITVGGRTLENAVWCYEEPIEAVRPIAGRLAFYADKVDRWLEEDEAIVGHVRSPFHRIDICDSRRLVRVTIGSETIAETRRARFLFETGIRTRYYVPREDVAMAKLTATPTRTTCPYKGHASYWSVRAGGRDFADVVWAYEDPLPEALPIKGMLAFWEEKIDGIEVEQQR